MMDGNGKEVWPAGAVSCKMLMALSRGLQRRADLEDGCRTIVMLGVLGWVTKGFLMA